MTDTCRYADMIFPVVTAQERESIQIVGKGMVTLFEPLVEAPGEAKTDMHILLGLAEKMGLQLGEPAMHSYEDYLRSMLVPTGITLEELRANPDGLPTRQELKAKTTEDILGGGSKYTISDSYFKLNGQEYNLSVNNGPNHLHGGFKSFSRRVWGSCVDGDCVLFTLNVPDGDEGYPGNMTVTVRFTFDNENVLTVNYNAISDKDTLCNITNHSYFNLNDLGLVTPVKNQGSMGTCWAFGAAGAFESSYLIATGIKLDISENNIKSLCLPYSEYGQTSTTEAGNMITTAAYFVSWLGAINTTDDFYDELGKVSSLQYGPDAVRTVNAVFINIKDHNAIKEYLTKYGAMNLFLYG